MARYLLLRLVGIVGVLWFVGTLTFFLMHAVPGGPWDESKQPLPADVKQNLQRLYGLDRPLSQQYLAYWVNLAHGNLGVPYEDPTDSVVSLIGRSWPPSAELGAMAMALAVLLGVPLGLVSALNQGSSLDRVVTTIAALGYVIPNFVLALGCDFYAFSGHKYVMAPQGTGGLFVRRDRIDWLQPSWIGSRSQREMDLAGNFVLHDAATRFEFGTRDVADLAGFGRAIELWEEIGWDAVFAQLGRSTDCLKAELRHIPNLVLETPLPYARSSGIVTFHLDGRESRPAIDELLAEDQILTSPVETPEFGVTGVRVSVHVYHTDAELDRLVNAVRRIAARPQ